MAAALHGVSPDMILAGNGSDDILSIAVRTFLGPGDMLAYPEPTYSLYPVLAASAENRVVHRAVGGRLATAHRGAARHRARAIFFANPNAPTGTFVRRRGCASSPAAFDGLVLVDEAYVDFADENCVDLVRELPNVVICRTLSKGYSLAGLRFGYAIAAPALVAEMIKVKDSYNCDAISILAATAAIEDQEYARRPGRRSARTRAAWRPSLPGGAGRSCPARPTSYSPPAPAGKRPPIYLALKRQGILVRYFDKPGLATSCASPSARPSRTTPCWRRCRASA